MMNVTPPQRFLLILKHVTRQITLILKPLEPANFFKSYRNFDQNSYSKLNADSKIHCILI